jgi:Zn ribbon nucleic-acid-binding protein
MSSFTKKSSKPANCPLCRSTDLVRRITTYPVRLSGPLEGKQIHVGRVALHECLTCGHLLPTRAGQAKVDRNVDIGVQLFLGQLH